MFGIFKRKPKNALEAFIFATYGNPPPKKSAQLAEAIQLAHSELLMGVVGRDQVASSAAELHAGPIPYSTCDLALSTALRLYKDLRFSEGLRPVQVEARMKMLEWFREGKVVRPLAQAFENELYQLYKE